MAAAVAIIVGLILQPPTAEQQLEMMPLSGKRMRQ
jgi:hypothetical protein